MTPKIGSKKTEAIEINLEREQEMREEEKKETGVDQDLSQDRTGIKM